MSLCKNNEHIFMSSAFDTFGFLAFNAEELKRS